jgi:hypothetical protein
MKAPYITIVHTLRNDFDKSALYDWTRKGEWAELETAHFGDDIPDDLFLQANVVLDVLNGKVKKNRITNISDEALMEYYFLQYEAQIVEAVKAFFKKYPEAWKSLIETAHKVSKELEGDENIVDVPDTATPE